MEIISEYIILTEGIDEKINLIKEFLEKDEKIVYKYKVIPGIRIRARRSTIEKIKEKYPDLYIEESKNYHILLKNYNLSKK